MTLLVSHPQLISTPAALPTVWHLDSVRYLVEKKSPPLNKNRKFAADGDIFMNNFSHTLFKPCFSGKSRSYTSLFVCVVTVTGVVILKSFLRLSAFLFLY